MKNIFFGFVLLYSYPGFSQTIPTTVVYNVRFIAPELKDKSAIAITDSKISAVGVSVELVKTCTGKCVKYDGKQKFLSPGFQDSHVHLIEGAKLEHELKIPSSADTNKLQELIKAYSKENPKEKWIVGKGWSPFQFPEEKAHKKIIDAAESVRPVLLVDTTGHQAWVNSVALKLAGITKSSEKKINGTVVKDAQGEPTGLLLEGSKSFISIAIPPMTSAELEKYILEGQKLSLGNGFTSMNGALIPTTVGQIQAYQRLAKTNQLKQRSFLWGDFHSNDDEFEEQIKLARSLPKNGIVQVVAFKGHVDGTLGSGTASMLKPYSNSTDNSGLLKISQNRLNKRVLRVNQEGFAVALHAAGDKAVRMALDAFEYSQKILKKTFKNRVEHVSIIDPEDISRFKKLDVVASMQPPFIYFSNTGVFSSLKKSLGERVSQLYSWKSLQNAGALLTFGTDYPSAGNSLKPDPITIIYNATHRQFGDGNVFNLKEAVSGEEAVKALTVNPAVALGMENSLGKIQVGYEADFVLLPYNPVDAKRKNLVENPIEAIFVAGKKVEL